MTTGVLASALIAILVVAGCGKKADDENAPAGVTSIVPGATPAAVGSAVGALGEADNPACKVLTRADAEAWIGHPLEENSGRPMPVGLQHAEAEERAALRDRAGDDSGSRSRSGPQPG